MHKVAHADLDCHNSELFIFFQAVIIIGLWIKLNILQH